MTYLCNFDALERLANAQILEKKELCGILGWADTDFSKAKLSQLNETQVRALEARFKCSHTEFCVAVDGDTSKNVFGDKEIREIYDGMVSEGSQEDSDARFVAVISGDGFLELTDQVFFDDICNYIRAGIEFKYYYADTELESSVDKFRQLYRKFEKQFGQDGKEMMRISGFKISREPSLFFGWKSRYILFCRREATTKRTHIEHGFNFLECAKWDESEGKQVDVSRLWIRMKDEDSFRYMSGLIEYAEPIKNLACYFAVRFDKRLLDEYRRVFSRDPGCEVYQEVVEALRSDDIVGDALETAFGSRFEPGHKQFEFLDVGFGDGRVTWAAIDRLTEIGGGPIRTTLLDSAGAPKKRRHAKMQNWQAINAPFEDWNDCAPNTFDLILACHSLYLIDPSYLDKVYDLLKPDGVALIIHAPRENNFINFVTDNLDRMSAGAAFAKARIHRGRLYAEELEAALKSRFGQHGIKVDKRTGEKCILPRMKVFDRRNRLTSFGKKLFELFACRDLEGHEVNEVAKLIQYKYGSDEFTNENWVISIEKDQVRERKKFETYGTLAKTPLTVTIQTRSLGR